MLIDFFFLGTMLAAIYKGLRNGLVVAVFSMVGWIIGLVFAVRFSGRVAQLLESSLPIGPRWLSIIAFTLIFIAVTLAIRILAGIIEKTMQLTLTGWINKVGGIFFYVILYTLIFCVIIYFADKVKLLSEDATSSSRIFHAFQPVIIALKGLL